MQQSVLELLGGNAADPPPDVVILHAADPSSEVRNFVGGEFRGYSGAFLKTLYQGYRGTSLIRNRAPPQEQHRALEINLP